LPKKIKASSDHNPVLFCNAVQSLEASRLRAPFTHATTSIAKKKKKKRKKELVNSVHADKAAESTGGDFNSCLREQGIKSTSSAPYSPESNGLAENFNMVLFARVRAFSITLA
jgi:transposase InsO family protein